MMFGPAQLQDPLVRKPLTRDSIKKLLKAEKARRFRPSYCFDPSTAMNRVDEDGQFKRGGLTSGHELGYIKENNRRGASHERA